MQSYIQGSVELVDQNVNGSANIKYSKYSVLFAYPCPDYTDCSPYVITLKKGVYQFEVWGAQGGGKNSGHGCDEGGKGGYSIGRAFLPHTQTFYVYVGSSGAKSTGNGGYNGGGAIPGIQWLDGRYGEFRGPGGGATDIRYIKGEITEDTTFKTEDYLMKYYGPDESLKSRLIVAGGGGGCNTDEGYGGGTQGSPLTNHNNETSSSGSQTGPGTSFKGNPGGLGYGGYCPYTWHGIAGGGAGYYGGGGASKAMGGSGYVNQTFFYHSITIAGNQNFTSPNDVRELGHSGDGYARITVIIISSFNYLLCFQKLFVYCLCIPLICS